MKLIPIIFILLTLKNPVLSQNNKVDSLISVLNNSDIIRDGDYSGPTFMLTGPAVDLLHIGKAATDKLLTVLEDSTKGVIAHCILTDLWSLPIPSISPIYLENEHIVIFQLNDLTFYMKGKNVFANQRDLRLRSIFWKSYISKQRKS